VQPAIEAAIDLGSVPNKVRSELARQVEEIRSGRSRKIISRCSPISCATSVSCW